MAGIQSNMHLYNLTLQKASCISLSAYGNYSAQKAQEIIVARGGKVLELLRPDDEGKCVSVLSWEVFGVVRDIKSFRLHGMTTDWLVVASDSGRINVLQYEAKKNRFVKVHEETYGKTGCRRIVPGQYLATDPKGRAIMISAIEKQKLVYVMNRDTAGKLTISSPLEAAKNRTIVYAVVGVDVGFDNPVFAALEVDYDQKLQENKKPIKMLTFYELDLGLNHVTRKASERCEDDANMLIPVPGTPEGPGGVLVCSENSVSYMDMVGSTPITAPIPRRFGQEESRGVLLVSYASHVQKTMFFFLVQSEFGDLYKITLSTSTEEGQEPTVLDVTVKYFDTIPVATTMAVLKTGFLFTGSESSNHYLFQFQGIGDDDDTPSASASQNTLDQFVYFQPRQLVNLLLVDELESLCPITDMKVAKLTANEQTPQIYTLCGRGPRSTLRVLRHGLAVQEMAVSELPGIPTAVWSVKKKF